MYITYISVHLAHHGIVRAKAGKGGMKVGGHIVSFELSNAQEFAKYFSSTLSAGLLWQGLYDECFLNWPPFFTI